MYEDWRRERLAEKVEESIGIIREINERRGDYPLIINFSGGRDSSSVLLLALEVTDEIECLFMSSGMDLPGSIEFVRRECARHGLKLHITTPEIYMGDFRYWVRKIGYFPNIINAYCSSRLKLRPQRVYWRQVYGNAKLYKLNGVRRFESTRRIKIYHGDKAVVPDSEHAGSYMIAPILNWSKWDVIEYLKQKEFKVNKNYTPFGVSGCYYCPFYEEAIYRKIIPVYPNIYDGIIELEKEMGKPSVNGLRYLGDIKDSVLNNKVKQGELW